MSRVVSGRSVEVRQIICASTEMTPMTHPFPVPPGNTDVCLTDTDVMVGLPPPMSKPHDTMLASYSQHTDSVVVVSGIVGGVPVTAPQDRKKVGRPLKNAEDSSSHSYKKREPNRCALCISSNRMETANTCKGRGGSKFCQFASLGGLRVFQDQDITFET